MTKKEAVEKLVKWAKEQVGYKPTNGKYNKYAETLDKIEGFYNGKKNGYDWCDVFVDCGMVVNFGAEIGRQMVYQPRYSCGAGCGYSANYYKANKAWYTSPQVGDQIFFGYNGGDHTGLVVAVESEYVTTVEGNYDNDVESRRLKKTDYRIAGYGRPNWALVADTAADVTPEPEKPVEPAKPVAEKVYTVKAGDNLSKIADMYDTTWKVLAEYNGIGNPNLIFVGQKIRIPGTKVAVKADIKVGDIVKLNNGATNFTGKSLASFVYQRNHEVVEISGERVVIAYQGTVVAAVNIKDLTKVN